MDKFLYRITLQPAIKFVLLVIINMFFNTLIYTFAEIFLREYAKGLCYWIFTVSTVVVTVITCFFLISVKDAIRDSYTETMNVGKRWQKRADNNKPLHWFWLKLLILPMLVFAVYCGYSFYIHHAEVMASIAAAIEADEEIDSGVFFYNIFHFGKIFCAIFFAWQWYHVRLYCKTGRCKKCKAAFAYGYSYGHHTEVQHGAKIKTKSRSVIIGEKQEITYEDGIEVDRKKIGDIYGTEKDYYLERSETTFFHKTCRCAFCNAEASRLDTYSSFSTTKLN